MASLNATLKFLSLPNACPLCVVAIDPETGHPIAVNSTFESVFGAYYKFKEWDFANAASEDSKSNNSNNDGEKVDLNRTRFREAIDKVRTSLGAVSGNGVAGGDAGPTARIRNVEMLTLGTNEAGLPIRRYFDWTIGSVALEVGGEDDNDGPASAILLYGDMVNEVETSNRARDAELIDFFQNAPIAMHWLNGDGIVLWANQTELNVLGYTAEEYIGKQLMNFCPDEEDLVLEIFKQLGSGNAIRDVPVRFRAKDGKHVHMLIDSNVAYNKDGSFGHTRCFIRDDTARKIRDARAKLLIDENERSLRMLDSFLSRTLHHVMGPLNALRGTCEVVSDRLQNQKFDEDHRERMKNCDLLERAADTVTTATRMVADVSDLARFDEGATLRTKFTSLDIRDVGLEAIGKIKFKDLRLKGGDEGITVALNLKGNGPRTLRTDRKLLLRTLAHLLENSVREVAAGGKVTLQITSSAPSDPNGEAATLVEVMDNGKGLPRGTCLETTGNSGTLFASSHRDVIGNRGLPHTDPDELQKARAEMEEGLRNLKQNGVGVGLPISYHLVRVLGGDLRHDAEFMGTRIWFTLPNKIEGDNEVLETETIFKKGLPPTQISFIQDADSSKKRKRDDADFGQFVSSDSSTGGSSVGGQTRNSDISVPPPSPPPAAVAKCGVKASMPFSVLVVEDTDICARLLAMQLKKMKCSTQRAENGQVAVDILKQSMPGQFDMVLMDLRMPVMDGLEATKLIRGELKMTDLPVLALTGEQRDDIRSECEGIGFTDFFSKPLAKKKLEEQIKKYKALRDGVE